MASLDTRRPAAMQQLAILGTQVGVDTLPIVPGQDPVAIAKRAKQQATLGGYDVVMLDSAGRLHVDDELMAEITAVRDATGPHETLLVVDGLTGEDVTAAVASRSNHPASRAVVARLASLGIDTSGVRLADNSGLLIENQVPAAVLAEVTAVAMERPDLRGAITGLPVAALEGTLSNRMHNAAAGVVRAKTGTLTTAVSLTGLAQDDGGRLLVFSVVADEVALDVDAQLAVDPLLGGHPLGG